MVKPGPKAPAPTKPMSDEKYDQLIALMRIECTRDEICGIFDMSEDTLNRRLKERGEENFAALYKKNCATGNASLRRLQWKSADKGNVTMQIWLGKQRLGQRDKVETDHTSSDGSMSPDGGVPAVERLASMLGAMKPKVEDEKPG